MPTLISQPSRVTAAGNKPKLIDEYIGRVNSGHASVSVAHMRSPGGWVEPGQRPEFDECTVVLRGMLRVEYEGGAMDVHAGRRCVRRKANGSAIPRLARRARSILRSACPPSRWKRSTATSDGQAGRCPRCRATMPKVMYSNRTESYPACAMSRASDGASGNFLTDSGK